MPLLKKNPFEDAVKFQIVKKHVITFSGGGAVAEEPASEHSDKPAEPNRDKEAEAEREVQRDDRGTDPGVEAQEQKDDQETNRGDETQAANKGELCDERQATGDKRLPEAAKEQEQSGRVRAPIEERLDTNEVTKVDILPEEKRTDQADVQNTEESGSGVTTEAENSTAQNEQGGGPC